MHSQHADVNMTQHTSGYERNTCRILHFAPGYAQGRRGRKRNPGSNNWWQDPSQKWIECSGFYSWGWGEPNDIQAPMVVLSDDGNRHTHSFASLMRRFCLQFFPLISLVPHLFPFVYYSFSLISHMLTFHLFLFFFSPLCCGNNVRFFCFSLL